MSSPRRIAEADAGIEAGINSPIWKMHIHKMARLEGFEPPTYGLEVRCSIQLSYRRAAANFGGEASWLPFY
jgi:hypothetical protein